LTRLRDISGGNIHEFLLAALPHPGQAAFERKRSRMFWSKSNKERQRYYLLAGMGGSSARRKQRIILIWSLAAGLLVALVLTLAMLWMNRVQVR
jgi:hypothetical protein